MSSTALPFPAFSIPQGPESALDSLAPSFSCVPHIVTWLSRSPKLLSNEPCPLCPRCTPLPHLHTCSPLPPYPIPTRKTVPFLPIKETHAYMAGNASWCFLGLKKLQERLVTCSKMYSNKAGSGFLGLLNRFIFHCERSLQPVPGGFSRS